MLSRGTEGEESIRLRALVKNQVFLLLVDSGSSATFVNLAFVAKAGLTVHKCSPVKVKVANGEELVSDSVVKGVNWCDGHTFTTNMRVLDLGAYDAILGFDWLKANSPMTCHWELKTLEFMNNGVWVKVQGIKQQQQLNLLELSCQQLEKWLKGNEVWALVVVEPCPAEEQPTTICEE